MLHVVSSIYIWGVFVTLAAEPGCTPEVQLRLFVPVARAGAWPPAA
jgi:hypothetical protein